MMMLTIIEGADATIQAAELTKLTRELAAVKAELKLLNNTFWATASSIVIGLITAMGFLWRNNLSKDALLKAERDFLRKEYKDLAVVLTGVVAVGNTIIKGVDDKLPEQIKDIRADIISKIEQLSK